MPSDRSETGRAFDSLDVYGEEWRDIYVRRGIKPPGPGEICPPPRSLVGLSLSGGGIRSATFNLGVLQALSGARLLEYVDYLSTVSGGGYIGGWWSAWRSRKPRREGESFPPLEGVETWRHLITPENENRVAAAQPTTPDPVHHVRLFSNYLTPRKGAFSRDLWRAVTVISRNLVLTWAALLPFVFIAVLLAHAMFLWTHGVNTSEHLTLPDGSERVRAVAGVPLLFLVGFVACSGLWLLAQRGSVPFQSLVTIGALATIGWIIAAQATGSAGFFSTTEWVVAVAVAAIAAARIVRPGSARGGRDVLMNWLSRLQGVLLVACLVSLIVGSFAAYGAMFVDYLFFATGTGWERGAKEIGKYVGLLTWAASAVRAAMAGAPAGGGETHPPPPRGSAARLLLVVAPPLTMLVILLAASWTTDRIVHIVDHRVWIPLVRQVTLIGAIVMVLYAFSEKRDATTEVWAVWVPGGAVLAAAIGGFLGLGSAPIMFLSLGGLALIGAWRTADTVMSDRVRQCLPTKLRPEPVRFDRAVLLIVAGCILTFGVGALSYDAMPVHEDIRLLLGLAALLFTTIMLIGWTTDPNSLSLHNFYKMRLVRAFLGASNPERTQQDAEDVTETRAQDDVRLANLAVDDGPYHLINGTLNLTSGSDLVVAQRAAAPFVFSRRFCGSARTGFQRTEEYRAGSLTLGTAVAISGAAASPVMGSQTPSTAMSMLMALLNVRLGYWLPTPNKPDWQAPQARLWPFYLLREFFSHVADTGSHCYVTDGGHFDNTGVYPLVERGCRTIVVTDCGADPDCVFDDLATLVRRCRIDFGANIVFPSLQPFSRATIADQRLAFVTGEIHYRPEHLKALGWNDAELQQPVVGTLIVVKPTLWGKLETDVNRYSQQQPDFPQQSTADQWFDEAQFESYRRLGEISGRAAVDPIRTTVVAAPARV